VSLDPAPIVQDLPSHDFAKKHPYTPEAPQQAQPLLYPLSPRLPSKMGTAALFTIAGISTAHQPIALKPNAPTASAA